MLSTEKSFITSGPEYNISDPFFLSFSEDNIKEFLLEPVKREWIKNLYSGIYKADLAKKPTEVEVTASFRKLNVS